MTGIYMWVFGMLAFVGIITLLDWLGGRKERQSRDRPV